jgi:hypothetical protein
MWYKEFRKVNSSFEAIALSAKKSENISILHNFQIIFVVDVVISLLITSIIYVGVPVQFQTILQSL